MDQENKKQETKKNKAKQPEYETGDLFEFCEVCRLNHDQGRRHKYFPSHVRSVSSLLSRFQKKIAGLRLFLGNPSLLPPDRLWCVFCGVDTSELDVSLPFARSSSIYHLASAEHSERVEDFLRKHGGGMDRADSFRVSDADLIKWEKGCKALKNAESASPGGNIRLTSASKVMRGVEYILNRLM